MRNSVAAIFALVTAFAVAQPAAAQYGMDKIEAEIKNMQSSGVKAYWENLNKADQDAISNNKLDNKTAALNLYKVVLMVHHHGYPTSGEHGYPAYTTPWLVWTHCRAVGLKQYTFGMIQYGKMLGQLPNDRYPNYFVGGWLLDLYGAGRQGCCGHGGPV